MGGARNYTHEQSAKHSQQLTSKTYCLLRIAVNVVAMRPDSLVFNQELICSVLLHLREIREIEHSALKATSLTKYNPKNFNLTAHAQVDLFHIPTYSGVYA
jgi:hypothetical protein